MCGRFTLMTEEEYQDLADIIREVEKNLGGEAVKAGDIYPTNPAPVLYARKGKRLADLFVWGFPNYYQKGVIINARAETAAEKPTFRRCLGNRCVIPAAGFYEWDGEKRKHLFHMNGRGIYMAGLYDLFGGEPHFVILTTAANPSVAPVHPRMPVVLTPEGVDRWIAAGSKALEILTAVPPPLQCAMIT